MQKAKTIQRDIIKTHRKELWTPFIKAIKDYHMIEDGDRIAVAMSGGKDSLLLACLLRELLQHPLVDFEIVLLSMDPGYRHFHRKNMENNFKMLNLDVKIVDKRLFEIVGKASAEYPCYLCAKMRRGILYTLAEKYGCNKLALGHHFDDVIETNLLNLFYAGTFKTMLPKLKADNFDNIELIRPLYYIKERSVINLMQRQELIPLDCACSVSAGQTASKRKEIKRLIADLKKNNPDIDKSIFNAGRNVNLNHVIRWELNGETGGFDD